MDSEFWETSAPQIVMELNIKIICEWHLSGHLTIIEGTDNRPKWHLGSWVSDQRCATDGFVYRSTHENLLHPTDFDISDSKNCSIQKILKQTYTVSQEQWTLLIVHAPLASFDVYSYTAKTIGAKTHWLTPKTCISSPKHCQRPVLDVLDTLPQKWLDMVS